MLYCVRCGDPIEKDELICDKCGLHFRVVTGDMTTVYMNQTPVPPGARPIQPGMPMQPGARPMPPRGRVRKPKSKASRIVGAISLVAVCAFFIVAAFALVGLGGFAVTYTMAEAMMEANHADETIVVNTGDADIGDVAYQPITYENTNFEMEDVDSTAIRDRFVKLRGQGQDVTTVMIYMNGSDLESNHGMATRDLREILGATLSDNVNVVIQTGGTSEWQTDGISGDEAQRFVVKNGALSLVSDNLGQLDLGDPQNLLDFITFCNSNYPANRNMLILWNHGGGVVYGYGHDDTQNDAGYALTLDEIQAAVRSSNVKFEMIGFDACLMGGVETAYAFYDCADYLIASEDFESGYGWEYQNWLTVLANNPSIPMRDLGRIIVDDFVKESSYAGADGILTLVDLRYAAILFYAWTEFAYATEEDLLSCNYNMSMEGTDRAAKWMGVRFDGLGDMFDALGNELSLIEYNNAVDLMALASTLDTPEANTLKTAVSSAIVYSSVTDSDLNMTGLSVTLPYNDEDFYYEMESVFEGIGINDEYMEFLYKFVDADLDESYNWEESDWDGWDSDYSEEDYYDDSIDWETLMEEWMEEEYGGF